MDGERHICKVMRQGTASASKHVLLPDPEAPPLAEVVGAMEQASTILTEYGERGTAQRLSRLVELLEAEDGR